MRNKPNLPDAEIDAKCGSMRGLGEEYTDTAPEKTKPICSRKAPANRRQAPSRGQIVRNKPNLAAWPAVRNKPNFHPSGYPSIPLFHYSRIPIRGRWYKQSQFPPGREGDKAAGRIHRAKQSQLAEECQVRSGKSQVNRAGHRALRVFRLQTSHLKLRRSRNRAKQTQFRGGLSAFIRVHQRSRG